MQTNVSIENIILKNIFLSAPYFNKVKSILNKDVFTDIGHSEIYSMITDYYKQYEKLPTLQEVAILTKDKPNKEVRTQIATKLMEIQNQENINSQFLDDLTLKFVKDQTFTHALMQGAEYIDKKDEKYKTEAYNLIEKMNKISLNDDLGADFSDIDARINYYQNPEKGIKFKRFDALNKRIGEGFLKGTLNLFLAPAGVGKSLLMSTSITDFLLQGYNVLLVSMEMSNYEFMKRIDADILDLPINDLKNIDPNIIKNKFKELNIGKLYVQNFPALTFSANNLDGLLEMYKLNDITFDVIFLDYLGLMRSDLVYPSVGLYSYIKSVGEEVRALAKRWEIPIFSASQLNRSAVNNTSADNSQISDSMGTAMTSDFMLFIQQDEKLKEQKQFLFKITKNRYTGRTDTFIVNVDYERMRIFDEYTPETLNDALQIENKGNTMQKAIEVQDMRGASSVSSFAIQQTQKVNDFWDFG